MTDPAPLVEQIIQIIETALSDSGAGGMVTGIIGAFEYVDYEGIPQVSVFDPEHQPIHRGAGILKVVNRYVDLVTDSALISANVEED